MKTLQCVPNFSEGRDPNFLRELQAVLTRHPVKVLDLSMNKDHNRADATFLGAPEAVETAAMAVASRALELIDMRTHKGSHPRMGAVDVVPFVPMRGMTMAEAVEIARRFGRAFAETHGIPVYFYEEACASEARRSLSDIRKGEYEGMPRKLQDPTWIVDAGPQQVNARSGVTAVGARMPLIAFNVNLSTDDVEVAKKIAKGIRHSSGGFRFVKAMGLIVDINGRKVAQVSMNMTDFTKTPLFRVVETIRNEAARYGVAIAGSEIVGLVPAQALLDSAEHYLQLTGFSSSQVLETRLRSE